MKGFESQFSAIISGASRRFHQPSALMSHLFPHDNIKASTGLVGEHNACVVIISVGVHIKRHAEVDCAELVISC